MAIVDTIFSPAFGNRPTHLVGRDGIIRDLLDGLSTRPGSRERAVLVLGQRGTGKTVLLWEIADRAREAGFVVAAPTIATDGMLNRIVEKIQDDGERYIDEDGKRVSGASIGALGFSAGLQFEREIQETKSFHYKLSRLCERLGKKGRGVLVLIDEVQANSSEVKQLVSSYQELVGEGRDVALMMAGLPGAVSETLNDRVLTFLNRATKVDLEPLEIGEIDAFLYRSFESLGVRISADLRNEAALATGGSPYLLQLIGHYIVRYAPDTGIVDAQVLSNALAASKSDYENDVCKTTLAALSDRDADFLCAMSQDSTASKVANIAERLGVTPDYAQKYRRRLLDAGVIEVARRGEVAFAVPYLADYLRKHR